MYGTLDEFFGEKTTSLTESNARILFVPWDATTSYHDGAALGPKEIIEASSQIDTYDGDFGELSKVKFYAEYPEQIVNWNEGAKELNTSEINSLCEKLHDFTYHQTKIWRQLPGISGFVGGDHSVPFSNIRHVGENARDWGILHLDAHFDLRDAYLGVEHSHASIMYNVMNSEWAPDRLIQVGIRDYCKEELEMARRDDRITFHLDADVQTDKLNGASYAEIAKKITDQLPKNVYLSFDIDGLDPSLCPGTGTPVPGGLNFQEMNHLLYQIVKSGRSIIGFDLDEVSPSEGDRQWNGNVGMRVLSKMIGWSLKSQGAAL